MNLKAAQNEWDRMLFWLIGVEIIALVVFLFLLYMVSKAAIRDGIKESGLTEAILALRKPTEEPKGPAIRAER